MADKSVPWLGCVADDITGATDLAINLVQGGLRVVQVMGIPSLAELQQLNCDAVVVALKIRSVEPAEAVAQALAGLGALRAVGCKRFMFKYCSTFDSTARGNIGPIADAMLAKLGGQQTVFCPAFPRNGRTLYQGHLFVGDRLLSESGMQHHPLNPMTDANLVRVLAAQTEHEVGLVHFDVIQRGAEAVRAKLEELARAGQTYVVLDACQDAQLEVLAEAVTEFELVTGGSGIARFLPAAYRKAGVADGKTHKPDLPDVAGRVAILSGSCSAATQRQVAAMQAKCPAARITAEQAMNASESRLRELLQWAATAAPTEPLMFYSTDSPEEVARLQAEHGAEPLAQAIESFHSRLAQRLVDELGVRKLIVAGGETSGAVANGLGIRALRIGPEICAGVPWTQCDAPTQLALAFKSGNFGDDDFFSTAIEMLPA